MQFKISSERRFGVKPGEGGEGPQGGPKASVAPPETVLRKVTGDTALWPVEAA